jgi:hypothetical protein
MMMSSIADLRGLHDGNGWREISPGAFGSLAAHVACIGPTRMDCAFSRVITTHAGIGFF